MISRLTRFLAAEDGAVTVDWVVLTAAIGLIGAAVVAPLATGTNSLGASLASFIDQTPTGDGW